MKNILTIIGILFLVNSYAQNDIHWDGYYKLQLSDFQSKSTKIENGSVNSFLVFVGSNVSFTMSNIEFAFTKNFNSKIDNVFKRESSSIIAVDKKSAQAMLNLAQYGFDLSELYARKLRKKIFEEKKTFSDISFLKPILDENQKQLTEEIGKASEDTKLGTDTKKLKELHEQVLKELPELASFCKQCKTPRKVK